MKIQLDLKELEKLKLSPNQYVFLFCKFSKKESFCSEQELSSLEALGFIKIFEQDIILRKKGIDLFELSDQDAKFFEFKANYPIKSGERRLHDKIEDCKKKYFLALKNNTHENILLGLENEKLARVEAAKKRQFFPEWKLMSTYINQQAWLTYMDYTPEISKTKIQEI